MVTVPAFTPVTVAVPVVDDPDVSLTVAFLVEELFQL